MKWLKIMLGIGLLLTSAATRIMAQEQADKDKDLKGAAFGGKTVSTKATVESIDKDKREVTLKKEDGTTTTIKCPESVRNFDQIKEGDIVTARYTEAIA